MSAMKTGTLGRTNIVYLPVDEISPGPLQPRRLFSHDGLKELASSISELGVLSPLTVRERGGKYELIAGERRLRASKMAGLSEVPCIILDIGMEQSAVISLVENLQRRDLDFVEEAEGIATLIDLFGMSQEEAARKLGKSQPAIANKLRLLKLPPDVLELMRGSELTERHARALLRLPYGNAQFSAAKYILSHGLTVAASEAYVERLLETKAAKASGRHATFIMKDIRLFVNTISRGLDLMRQGGIESDMERSEDADQLVLTIKINKKA